MILGYNYVDRTATIQSFDGTVFVVPLGRVRLGNTYPDLATLILERKCNPADTRDDIVALREDIVAWPDFEEKEALLAICDARLREDALNAVIVRNAALREAYGILHGTIIARAVCEGGKLEKHADVITHAHVVDLVSFLVQETPYLACTVFPSPKGKAEAVRACQRSRWKDKAKKLGELVADTDSFELFTAFRVASYLEKVTMPHEFKNNAKGVHT